jgi:hypothetical protein
MFENMYGLVGNKSGEYKFLMFLVAVVVFLGASAIFMVLWNASFGAALHAPMNYTQSMIASSLVWFMRIFL